MLDFYPDILLIAGKEYKCQVSAATGVVLLPYKEEPAVKQGDIIIHKAANKDIEIKAIDVSFRRIGTFSSSNKTPHMLTMKIEVVSGIAEGGVSSASAAPGQPAEAEYIYVPMDLQEFVKQVSASNDSDAKETLITLLKNSTANTLLGPRASYLLKLFNA